MSGDDVVCGGCFKSLSMKSTIVIRTVYYCWPCARRQTQQS